MAFCPNCGTPNTEQAEKCTACGFELAAKQKAKFKGTIMMSGIKAPGAPSLPPADPSPKTSQISPKISQTTARVSQPAPRASQPPVHEHPDIEPEPARASVNPAFARNSSYAKTMLGHVPSEPPPELPDMPRPTQSNAPERDVRRSLDSFSTTMQGPSPSLPSPAPRTNMGSASMRPSGSPPHPRASEPDDPTRASDVDLDARSEAHDDAPASERRRDKRRLAGPSKMMLLGCAGTLAVSVIVVGLLYYALAPKLRVWLGTGRDADAQAAAWHAQLTQALTQVAELCKTDCQKADVFFHPVKQIVLLGEAKALNAERVRKLGQPPAKAEMLDLTDDARLASELALDATQCVRVVLAGAKVVSCSVPEPSGRAGVLRIVHLSGVGTL